MPALQNNVFKLRGLAQTADGANADLISLTGGQRSLTNLACGYLHVLLLQRSEHVSRGQSALGHASGIEPQAHGVFAFAKNEHVADTWDALDGVSYVEIQIIAQKQAVVCAIRRIDAGTEDEAAELFGDDDASVFYRVWQATERLVDAILDIDGGQVYVTGHIKSYGDLAGAVIAAGGA